VTFLGVLGLLSSSLALVSLSAGLRASFLSF
jgi:hypothetical protein